MATYQLCLVLLSILVRVTVCQQSEPIHCCVEPQFIVVERTVAGSIKADGTGQTAIMTTQTIANNYKDKETAAEVVTQDSSGAITQYKIIQSFDLGFGWIIQDGVCTQFEFEGHMPDNCVPYDRDIQYMGPVRYMGFVPAQSWRMVLWPDIGARGIVDFIVAEDGCKPIMSSFRGQDNSEDPITDTFDSGFFYNFTSGIDDPDKWFKVPDDCPQFTANDRSRPKRNVSPVVSPPFFHMGGHRYNLDRYRSLAVSSP